MVIGGKPEADGIGGKVGLLGKEEIGACVVRIVGWVILIVGTVIGGPAVTVGTVVFRWEGIGGVRTAGTVCFGVVGGEGCLAAKLPLIVEKTRAKTRSDDQAWEAISQIEGRLIT